MSANKLVDLLVLTTFICWFDLEYNKFFKIMSYMKTDEIQEREYYEKIKGVESTPNEVASIDDFFLQ